MKINKIRGGFMRYSRTCWFAFEGENKGDDILSETEEQAAIIYYLRWHHEVEQNTRIFVRSEGCVKEWHVTEARRIGEVDTRYSVTAASAM
jgi:hypothetical protein